jgi:hypothetical protein
MLFQIQNFLTVENGEFRIQEWQAAKKLEHAVCFGLKPEDFGFSQDQAKQINAKGGIVAYVRKGNKIVLKSMILKITYQIKFVEARLKFGKKSLEKRSEYSFMYN